MKSRPLQQIPGYNESFARVCQGLLYPGFTVVYLQDPSIPKVFSLF